VIAGGELRRGRIDHPHRWRCPADMTPLSRIRIAISALNAAAA
jgi:hypothetical protein